MAKLTFVGGIHPYDGKDLSKDKPIQDVDRKSTRLNSSHRSQSRMPSSA